DPHYHFQAQNQALTHLHGQALSARRFVPRVANSPSPRRQRLWLWPAPPLLSYLGPFPPSQRPRENGLIDNSTSLCRPGNKGGKHRRFRVSRPCPPSRLSILNPLRNLAKEENPAQSFQL